MALDGSLAAIPASRTLLLSSLTSFFFIRLGRPNGRVDGCQQYAVTFPKVIFLLNRILSDDDRGYEVVKKTLDALEAVVRWARRSGVGEGTRTHVILGGHFEQLHSLT